MHTIYNQQHDDYMRKVKNVEQEINQQHNVLMENYRRYGSNYGLLRFWLDDYGFEFQSQVLSTSKSIGDVTSLLWQYTVPVYPERSTTRHTKYLVLYRITDINPDIVTWSLLNRLPNKTAQYIRIVWNGRVCTRRTKGIESWLKLIEPYAPKYIMYRNISRELSILGNNRFIRVRNIYAQEFGKKPSILMSKKNMIRALKDKYIKDGNKTLNDSDID